MHQRIDRRVGRPGHDRAEERGSGRLAAALDEGFEEGAVDELGIDIAALVVAELGGEERELATCSAPGERRVGDDQVPVDVAVGAGAPLGQRTAHHHGEHLVVGGGRLGPTLDGVSMMLLHGPSRSTRSLQAPRPARPGCLTLPLGKAAHSTGRAVRLDDEGVSVVEEVSIGEFARRSRLSVKALRLYDELGVLVPARVDQGSGYRYYDVAQLEAARVWLR